MLDAIFKFLKQIQLAVINLSAAVGNRGDDKGITDRPSVISALKRLIDVDENPLSPTVIGGRKNEAESYSTNFSNEDLAEVQQINANLQTLDTQLTEANTSLDAIEAESANLQELPTIRDNTALLQTVVNNQATLESIANASDQKLDTLSNDITEVKSHTEKLLTIDSNVVDVKDRLPNSLGRKSEDDSLAVVLSNEDKSDLSKLIDIASYLAPIPDKVTEQLFDVMITPTPLSACKTVLYSLKAVNPNNYPVYVRLYDSWNPNTATTKPKYLIPIEANSHTILQLGNEALYEFENYCVLSANKVLDYSDTTDIDTAVYIETQAVLTLPTLAAGQSFLTDSDGNYLIDNDGNYLIA